jgi:hypothetical protein
MYVPALREELAAKGLSTKGLKAVLAERTAAHRPKSYPINWITDNPGMLECVCELAALADPTKATALIHPKRSSAVVVCENVHIVGMHVLLQQY